MLIRCSRQCFSYTTGLQPGRTIQPIAIVQYIQHCIYPPPHGISSRPNLTHQTRYSYSWSPPGHLSEPNAAHASSHEASAEFNIARALVLKTNSNTVPAPLGSLSSGAPVQTGSFILQLSEVNIPGNTIVPVYKFHLNISVADGNSNSQPFHFLSLLASHKL